jgi:hypothetical protein
MKQRMRATIPSTQAALNGYAPACSESKFGVDGIEVLLHQPLIIRE